MGGRGRVREGREEKREEIWETREKRERGESGVGPMCHVASTLNSYCLITLTV